MRKTRTHRRSRWIEEGRRGLHEGNGDALAKHITDESISSQEEEIMNDIEDKIGAGHVTVSAIAFEPSWVVEKEMRA